MQSDFPKIATFVGESFFADSLAQHILDCYYVAEKPCELSKLTVFLPTRRACQSLKQALFQCADSASIILPNITTISDLNLLDFLPINHVFWQEKTRNLIARSRRIFWVSEYLLKLSHEQPHLFNQKLSVVAAMNYAESFLSLRDDFLRANVSLIDLHNATIGEYAQHWQNSLDLFVRTMDFLDTKLLEHDLYEAIPHQQYLIQTLCDYWAENPHQNPIIAAGSTGSAPSTANLLEAIYKLPYGSIILRELDIWLQNDAFEAAHPTHPAYNLKQLLHKLCVDRDDVTHIVAGQSGRGELASLIFNPSNKLHEYEIISSPAVSAIGSDKIINLHGVEWLECQDEAEEIAAICLKIRHALSEGLKDVIVISDDDIFNMRLKTCLNQYDIAVDISAGIAAHHHPEYNFMLLVARILFEPYASVNCLSLLRHPAISGITSPLADYLDNKVVRGLHNVASLQALLNHFAGKTFEAEIARGVELLRQIMPYAEQIQQRMSLFEIAQLHQNVWQILRGSERTDSSHALDILSQNMQNGAENIYLNPLEYIGILQQQCEKQREVYPSIDAHVRIIGALELRLQMADLLIMPRMNAGIFPLIPSSDPWLNRDIRRKLGLNYFERKIGLSAHDMAIMLRFPNVLFSRSRKIAGALKNASPFFERLKLVMQKGNISPANYLLEWLEQMQPQNRIIIPDTPKISPPLHLRPHSLSATACESAFSNPFKLYVNNICKLKELEPIDDELNQKYFGKVLHAALHNASISYNSQNIEPYLKHVQRNFEDELISLMPIEVAQFYHNKLNIILQEFFAAEIARLCDIAKIETESKYQIDFRLHGGTIINLNARIDRIEYLRNHGLRVVDYKTGAAPTNAEIADYSKCQLLVAKLILMSLHNDINVDQMEYWSLTGKLNNNGIIQPIKGEYNIADITEKLRDKLSDLIENPDADYYYNLDNNINYYGKIEHLARV